MTDDEIKQILAEAYVAQRDRAGPGRGQAMDQERRGALSAIGMIAYRFGVLDDVRVRVDELDEEAAVTRGNAVRAARGKVEAAIQAEIDAIMAKSETTGAERVRERERVTAEVRGAWEAPKTNGNGPPGAAGFASSGKPQTPK